MKQTRGRKGRSAVQKAAPESEMPLIAVPKPPKAGSFFAMQQEENEEYVDPDTNRKRKRAPASLENQSIHTTLPPERHRVDKSSLIIKDKLSKFKSSTDFASILEMEGRAYFDRTRYISVLNAYEEEPILFLRPRRFGKSLTVDMLEHFHGLQYRDEHKSLYKGLDVQDDIANGRVTPGQFFILKFDFSSINRSPNVDAADQFLKDNLTASIKTFYETYSRYLGGDVDKLLKNINYTNPNISLLNCIQLVRNVISKAKESREEQLAGIRGIYLLVDEYDTFSNDYLEPYSNVTWQGTAAEATFKSFWSTVKSLLGPTKGISRTFITGILPLSLTSVGSGFNVARNISSDKNVAGLCGLTRTDIEAALKEVGGSDTNAYKKHLSIITNYFNGYHFCDRETVETVYNTVTCIDYLQSVIEGTEPPVQPIHAEVSEKFLQIFASSPAAIRDFQKALERDENNAILPFHYSELMREFKLADLNWNIEKSKPAWRSLMLYFGGLTFYDKDPKNFLKIPNEIAARRIAETVLEKFGLRQSLNSALEYFQHNGNIRQVLSCYRTLMVQRDVGFDDFNKSEETHRDSFYFSLLRNHFIRPNMEVKVVKSNCSSGRVDLVIPLNKYLIVSEWKVVQIDYIDVRLPTGQTVNRINKANALSNYTLQQILELRFNDRDKLHGNQTLLEWIQGKVAEQLREYILSDYIKKLAGDLSIRGYVVIIVGSRHIITRAMNGSGKLGHKHYLVGDDNGNDKDSSDDEYGGNDFDGVDVEALVSDALKGKGKIRASS